MQDASILIVDDEPVNVKLLLDMLNVKGYPNVISTTDPREALGLYEEHKCDLVLLDINMPHMDGYEVMAQLKEKYGEKLAPILVLTAQQTRDYKIKALTGGASDYVTKPFQLAELIARVKNLLQVRLAHKLLEDRSEVLESMVKKRTQELVDAHQQLQDNQLKIVRFLGRAAEYRDNETGFHIIRVSKIAALLAESIGWDNEQVDLILNASPMHDIGKIGIPDSILLKPAKLTQVEWEIMKTHPAIGAEILSGDNSKLIHMAQEIALSHHEKWNGKGYPNGLSGEGIPMAARLTAIADVFDALSSRRPYKDPWPVEKTMAEIQLQKGEHFDPMLVEHFLKLQPEILAISECYAEPTDETHLRR